MLKLCMLTFALLLVYQCQMMPGGVSEGTIDDYVLEIADWTAQQMSDIRGDNGLYSVQNIKSVKKQVVSGIKNINIIFFQINWKAKLKY